MGVAYNQCGRSVWNVAGARYIAGVYCEPGAHTGTIFGGTGTTAITGFNNMPHHYKAANCDVRVDASSGVAAPRIVSPISWN